MTSSVDLLLVLVVLTNFLAVGTSRLRVCIRASAMQGMMLAMLPLLAHREAGWRAFVLAGGTALLKGWLIPRLLMDAIREVRIGREVTPFLGFVPSLVICAIGTALALVFSDRMPLAPEHVSSLYVSTALSGLLSGFIILVARRKAIMQVVGYVLVENGIFVFGLLLIEAMPFMVEVGVLLDLFAGIFIMGIVLNHIRNEFESLDTAHLADLKED